MIGILNFHRTPEAAAARIASEHDALSPRARDGSGARSSHGSWPHEHRVLQHWRSGGWRASRASSGSSPHSRLPPRHRRNWVATMSSARPMALPPGVDHDPRPRGSSRHRGSARAARSRRLRSSISRERHRDGIARVAPVGRLGGGGRAP